MVTEATAESLLHKLGAFTRSLDGDERELFAALIGPGVANAIGSAEVEGFAAEHQEADRLVHALTDLARRVQLVEADDSEPGTGDAS